MAGLGPLLIDPEIVGEFVRDADGSIRGALICWGIALGAFIVLRVPREVLLTCLLIATATVGFGSLVVESTSFQAAASSPRPQPSAPCYRTLPRSAIPSGSRGAN